MSGTETSAEVQREAEAERAKLSATLDKLRENLRPANMVDEVLSGVEFAPSDVTDTVWKTVRANPIPAALIGIGAAMLLGVGKTVSVRKAAKDYDWTKEDRFSKPSTTSRRQPTALPRVSSSDDRSVKRAPRQTPKSAATSGGSASLLPTHASGRGEGSPDTFSSRPLPASKDAAMSYTSRNRNQLTSSIATLLDEQPLVLAALGIAVGAAIGAAIPTTETEGRFMGQASGSVKRSAQEIAQDQLDHLKAKAGETLEDIKQTVAEHGVSSENLSGLISDVKGKVKDAASDVANHASDVAPKA